MPDTIAFRCTNCKKAYRVGQVNAGRSFQCTNCKADLTVPLNSTNSGVLAPLPQVITREVDMDAGNEVVFKQTDSQRRESINPTKIFTRERQTGATMPADVQQKSGKGLLVTVIAILILGGAGAGVYFLQHSNSKNEDSGVSGPGDASKNTVAGASIKEKTLGEKLIEESEKPDVTPKRLLEIVQEAAKAKVSKNLMSSLHYRAVEIIISTQGGDLSIKELFAFAKQMERSGYQEGAERIYNMIIGRESGKDVPSDDLKKAHEKLGDIFFNLDELDSLVAELENWPFLSGVDKLKSALVALKEKANSNWLNKALADEAKGIKADLEEIKAELDAIKKDMPFRLEITELEAEFRKTIFARLYSWKVIARKPFVFFMQSGIDEVDGNRLMDKFQSFHNFYIKEFVTPLGLSLTQPSSIADEAKRAEAPIVFFLLNSPKSWQKYLRAFTSKSTVETQLNSWHAEYQNGRVSGLYGGGSSTEAGILDGMRTVIINYYHPDTPKDDQENAIPKSWFNSYVLSTGFDLAMRTQTTDNNGETTYFAGSQLYRAKMTSERTPFLWDGKRPSGFGGPIVTPKQMVTARSEKELMDFARNNIKGYGWNKAGLKWAKRIFASKQTKNISDLTRGYTQEFLSFLFNFKSKNRLKYRKQFIQWFHAEIKGEVTAENQAASFEKIFEVKDDSDWKNMDDDFAAWCAKGE